MNNKLPIVKKDGFFAKIKIFFKNLFINKHENIDNQALEQETLFEEESKNMFENNIKVEVDNKYLDQIRKDDFIKQVEANPNILYDLPVEKIEKFIQHYEKMYEDLKKENEELEKKIKKVS